MKELRDIINTYKQLKAQRKLAALATIVNVEGSSYRQPGARMLIAEDGTLTGAISGGCLERDIQRKALAAMAFQKPQLVTYDSRSDEDDIKAALGCNGVAEVFIEPLAADDPTNPICLLEKVVSHRKKAALATVYATDRGSALHRGTSILAAEGLTRLKSLYDPLLTQQIYSDAKVALFNKKPNTIAYSCDGEIVKVFIDYIAPAVSLVVIGAGNDAIPLVNLANMLGWDVTVADGRTNYATSARFPEANVIVARPEKITSKLPAHDQTAFVIMTHNYSYDLAALKELIQLNTPYIGILGPQSKQQRLLQDLELMGVYPGSEHQMRLYGPVGLDIGAETPEEIALSIIAEIKKVLSAAPGTSLRDKTGKIHAGSTRAAHFDD